MKDRIRYSLIYMGVLAALFAVYFTVRVFEGEMAEQLKSQLRENLSLIERAYINESLDTEPQKLAKFANKDLRITLIDFVIFNPFVNMVCHVVGFDPNFVPQTEEQIAQASVRVTYALSGFHTAFNLCNVMLLI